MNNNVGQIIYNAVINTQGLQQGAAEVNNIIGGVGKVAAAAVAAGAVATAGLVAASVKAFATYEQMIGGVDTLFKQNSATVQAYAQNAYKTAGLSANQYMATVTSFSASLLQGLGGDTKRAAEIGNVAVTDMSDNANKFGTSMESIQLAYQGFAKDNFTMLDNLKLGYGGTQEEMARLVNNSGVMGASFKATAENVKDIPFDKLIEAIHKTQTELGITGTTAKEASSTISGSFASVKASWENVLTSFGTGNNAMIKASIDGLMEGAKNLLTNLSVILPNILMGIGQLVTTLAAQLPAILQLLIPALTGFLVTAVQVIVNSGPQFVGGIVQLITAMAQALAQQLPILIPKLITGLQDLVKVIVANLPTFINAAVQIVIALVNGLIQAMPTLIPQIQAGIMLMVRTLLDNLPQLIRSGVLLIIALVQGIANSLPIIAKFIPEIINTIVQVLTTPQMIKLLLMASLQIIVALAVGLIQALPVLISSLANVITSLLAVPGNYISAWTSIGGDMLRGIWNGMSNAAGWVMGKIKSLLGGMTDQIKNFFGIHSPSTLFRDEIGKNLALGIGEGFTDTMTSVSADMQNSMPTPSIDYNGMASYGSSGQPQTIVVKVGDETLLTKIIDGINDKSMLQGYNAIKV